MKKRYTAVIGIALALTLSACTVSPAAPQPTPTPAATQPAVPETDEAPLSAEFIAERFLSQLGEHESFDDAGGSEYAENVLFTAKRELSRFCYLSLDGSEGTELFAVDGLPEGGLVLISTVFEGVFPDRAVAVTDVDGVTGVFALSESGEDHLPLLVPLDGVTIIGVQEHPGPDSVKLVNPRGDENTVTKQPDGSYLDADGRVFSYDGEYGWFDPDGTEWNESLA